MKKRYPELREPFLRRLLTGLAIFFAILYVGWALSRYWDVLLGLFQPKKNLTHLTQQFSHANALDFVVLTLLTALGSAVPFLSNGVLAIFNGVVFGPWLALVMNLGANILGNWIMIKVLDRIQLVGHEQKFSRQLAVLERLNQPYLATCIGYMVPIFPTLLVNYLVIKANLEPRYWLVSVAVGVFPTSCLYAFGGDAIVKGNFRLLLILLGAALLIYLIGRIAIKVFKA